MSYTNVAVVPPSNDTQTIRYDFIATHYQPHAEEIAAIWILKNMPEAEELFPGIKDAQVIFWGSGSQTPDKRSAQSWKNRGYVLVGVGGGEFDEHPANGLERKANESAFSLVAKALGLLDAPWLNRIIEILTQEDLHGGSGEMSIMSLAKLLHEQNPDDPHSVIEWTMMGLGAKMKQQLTFHNQTKKDFDRHAQIETLADYRGEPLGICSVVSDDEQMGRYIFAQKENRVDVAIIRKTTGNTVILTRKSKNVDMRDIVRVLRIREMEVHGEKNTFTPKMLEDKEGTIAVKGGELWHNFTEGKMILNGSRTAKDIAPTKLSLEEIVQIVKICLNRYSFPNERSQKCLAGNCSNTNHNRCKWFDLGLIRCRGIRYAQYENNKETK